MTEVLAFAVIVALVGFILTIGIGWRSEETPPLYWSLVFVTGFCAILLLSIS